jgi:plasmid stabilization system protein ParE
MGALKAGIYLPPAAEADLAQAIAWYESQRPGLAYEFRLSLDATLDQIARYPEACACVTLNVRRALLRRFPYAVYYRGREGLVEIIAIAHTHRDARIWRRRNQ